MSEKPKRMDFRDGHSMMPDFYYADDVDKTIAEMRELLDEAIITLRDAAETAAENMNYDEANRAADKLRKYLKP